MAMTVLSVGKSNMYATRRQRSLISLKLTFDHVRVTRRYRFVIIR